MEGEEGEGLEVRVRTILVGLDGSGHSREALRAAARIARALEAELTGLFVEEEEWHGIGALGTSRMITGYTGRSRPIGGGEMSGELRAAARRVALMLESVSRSLELRSNFRVERGRAASVLLGASGEVDLITLGHMGWSPARSRRLGTTTRLLIEESEKPILLLRRGAPVARQLLVVHDGSASADRALALALGIAQGGGLPMRVVAERTAGEGDSSTKIRRLLAARGLGEIGLLEVSGLTRLALSELVSRRTGTLVVAPRSARLFQPDRIERTLTIMPAPLLLV